MKRKLLCLLILCATAAAFGAPDIDSLFQDFQGDVPGASVAVMQNGKIVFEKGYGMADLENNVPATAETNYRLASLTKQFTAMSVLELIDQGKLTFDTKLTDIFPEFPSYGKRVTIRELLNHISGLEDYEDLIPGDQSAQVSDQDVLKLLEEEHSTKFTPGSAYEYNNGNYVLLGLVVEKVSQQDFSDYMQQHIFGPLGMTHSLMYEKGKTVTDRAYGYSPSMGGFTRTDQSVTSATRGDGGVYTSAHEWVLWDNALNTHQLISADLQKLAFTPGTLNDGSQTSYGFGWMLGTFQGLIHQYHTGSTIGFRTGVDRFPEKGLTVVVLCNRANSSPWEISRRIAQMYF